MRKTNYKKKKEEEKKRKEEEKIKQREERRRKKEEKKRKEEEKRRKREEKKRKEENRRRNIEENRRRNIEENRRRNNEEIRRNNEKERTFSNHLNFNIIGTTKLSYEQKEKIAEIFTNVRNNSNYGSNEFTNLCSQLRISERTAYSWTEQDMSVQAQINRKKSQKILSDKDEKILFWFINNKQYTVKAPKLVEIVRTIFNKQVSISWAYKFIKKNYLPSSINKVRKLEIDIFRETELKKDEPVNNSNFSNITRGRKRGPKMHLRPEQYVEIGQWVENCNVNGIQVSISSLCQKVYDMVHWRPSKSWASRTFAKLGIKRYRAQKRTKKQLSPEFEAECNQWLEETLKIIHDKNLSKDKIFVMDETAVWNRGSVVYTYSSSTNSKPWITSISNNRKDTFAVSIGANGVRYIYPISSINQKTRVNEFGQRVIVEKGRKGMNLKTMKKWAIDFVEFVRLVRQIPVEETVFLLMDNLACHKNKDILGILERNNIMVRFLPVGSAYKFSPLDNSLFAKLKRKLGNYQFFNILDKTKGVKEIMKDISNEEILNYFIHCGYYPPNETLDN